MYFYDDTNVYVIIRTRYIDQIRVLYVHGGRGVWDRTRKTHKDLLEMKQITFAEYCAIAGLD